MACDDFYPSPGTGGRTCVMCGEAKEMHASDPVPFSIGALERRLERGKGANCTCGRGNRAIKHLPTCPRYAR